MSGSLSQPIENDADGIRYALGVLKRRFPDRWSEKTENKLAEMMFASVNVLVPVNQLIDNARACGSLSQFTYSGVQSMNLNIVRIMVWGYLAAHDIEYEGVPAVDHESMMKDCHEWWGRNFLSKGEFGT